jgi:hypothetical protein
MAAVGAYLAARLLNVSLKQTANLASPATLGFGLSLGTPTSVSMSEVGTSSGYTPQSITMSSVAASGTVASNANAMTFGPFSSAKTIFGGVIKDTLVASASNGNKGNLYFFGLLNSSVVLASGDTITFAAGALTITLQ